MLVWCRDEDNDYSTLPDGTRPDWFWTGPVPQEGKAGIINGRITSLPIPNCSTAWKEAVLEYFDNTWLISEIIFSGALSWHAEPLQLFELYCSVFLGGGCGREWAASGTTPAQEPILIQSQVSLGCLFLYQLKYRTALLRVVMPICAFNILEKLCSRDWFRCD